jgi:hypothetical protein
VAKELEKKFKQEIQVIKVHLLKDLGKSKKESATV